MKKGFLVLCFLLIVPMVFGSSSKLYLKYGVVDTSVSSKTSSAEQGDLFIERYIDNRNALFILQFNQAINEQIKDNLKEKGVTICEYIPDNALAVWARQSVIDSLNLTTLQYKGVFQPAYRVDRSLINLIKNKTRVSSNMEMKISFFSFIDDSVINSQLAEVGATVLRSASSRWQKSYKISVPATSVSALANMQGVKWIEKYIVPVLFSKEAPFASFKDSSGYDIFNEVSSDIMNVSPLWSAGYKGAGQVAAIADTGLDVGNTSSIHDDFAGRIVATYALGRTGDWSDPDGHGTHCAGSVLGDGTMSSGRFKGMAYQAGLVFQSTIDSQGSLSGLPNDLNDLFGPAYDDGARIHSNSWGLPLSYGGHVYNSNSQQVDQFIWDHKDMVITIAAGNDGTDSNSDGVVDLNAVSSPSTAKNCICVGATESDINATSTSWGAAWSSDYPADPVKSDPISDNRNGMAAFSSRGPAPDGRIKPDVSAPGTMIVSVRSQHSSAGTGWGVYDDYYVYMGGTSMANPLTAGGATVTRDFFVDHEGVNPSSALIKAALVNGAYDMYPGQYGTSSGQEMPTLRPNVVEGWGRVNLGNSLMPSAPVELRYADETSGVSTNGTKTYTFSIADSSYPFKVTVVWSDYPSSTSASVNLVNDLDLTVTGPTGTVYYPNGKTSADRLNNTETVDILSPSTGEYTVTVKGYNVPYGPQPFALAVLGAFGTVDPDTEPPVISSVSAEADYESVIITWSTDEAATSVVDYGTSTSLGQTASTSGYSTGHNVTVTGLAAETTYYYRVKSADSSNNESLSSIYSFVTDAEPVIATSFSDDMESGDSKWSKNASGSTPWAITSTSYAHSGSYAWFSADEASIKDDSIQTEVVDLRSATSATLSFYHTYKFETNYDGGVIEISTNGGSSFTDLGGNITSGGYTGTISTSYSSPIAGRSAWTGGTVGTMSQVVVDLSSYTGNNVIIRFRLGCDSSVNSTGWYLDDVQITADGVVTDPEPVINSFTASPSTIESGSSSTLSWTTTDATSCSINGSSVSVDGSTTVSPTSTTTYTLTATGPGGTVSQSVTVTVTQPDPEPVINSFTASPSTIESGSSSTLSWTTTDATSCTINGSSVSVDGSTTVSPTSTTTYTLTATGPGGTVSQSVTVTVTQPDPEPVINSFTASPSTIESGSSSTLSWTTTDATSCSINGSSVSVDGSTTVSPTSTTTYTLTATGPGGTISQSMTVTVTQPVPEPVINSFTASPTTIDSGNSSTLSWTTTDATSCTVNGSSVAVDGTMTVSPSSTTTYTLVATSAGGSVSQDVTVTVNSNGTTETRTFSSSDIPKSIPDNNSTGVSSTIQLADGYGIESLTLNVDITHTYIGDLEVSLISPSGTVVVVHDNSGGSADNINESYSLTNFNGQNAVGTWTLKVVDSARRDTGTIDNWSLVIKAQYNSQSHSFSSADTPLSIPDNNSTGVTSNINVTASATVTSFDVTVDITHTYIGDLVVTLYTPDGGSVVLHDRADGSADNIHKTWTINSESGVAINGQWSLKVTDNAGYDTGTIDSWSLNFNY